MVAIHAGQLLRSMGPRFQPTLDSLIQHAQRHRSIIEQAVVEFANIESGAKPVLRTLPKSEESQFTDLVGQRLRWPSRVAQRFVVG